MRFDNEGNNGSDGHEGMNVFGFDWYPWHIDECHSRSDEESTFEFGMCGTTGV
ncbi:MAG: hypothetical protein WAM43_18760 [Terriglobales bacterium]